MISTRMMMKSRKLRNTNKHYNYNEEFPWILKRFLACFNNVKYVLSMIYSI